MKLNYENILIREATVEDAEFLCRWWNDGKVMEHAGFPNGLGITIEEVREEIKETKGKLHIIVYMDYPVGEMGYREIDLGICEIGIKICDFSKQNKGIGKTVLSLFINALFNDYDYHKIVLDTNLNNNRSQHVYERLGFQKRSINHNSWKDQLGNWQSSVDYELTKDCFVSFIRG